MIAISGIVVGTALAIWVVVIVLIVLFMRGASERTIPPPPPVPERKLTSQEELMGGLSSAGPSPQTLPIRTCPAHAGTSLPEGVPPYGHRWLSAEGRYWCDGPE